MRDGLIKGIKQMQAPQPDIIKPKEYLSNRVDEEMGDSINFSQMDKSDDLILKNEELKSSTFKKNLMNDFRRQFKQTKKQSTPNERDQTGAYTENDMNSNTFEDLVDTNLNSSPEKFARQKINKSYFNKDKNSLKTDPSEISNRADVNNILLEKRQVGPPLIQGVQTQKESTDYKFEWVMDIGNSDKDKKDQKKEDENILWDVYPLNIKYTPKQMRIMKILRIVSLIVCFFFTIPFDLYIPSSQRIGYFGTEVQYLSVPLNDSLIFKLNLQNCKLYLETNGPDADQFDIQFGFNYGQSFRYQELQVFEIIAPPVETCIVNLKLPTGKSLPRFIFNMTGNQDNIMVDDSKLGGQELNFSKGLEIVGDVAYIILNNHNISVLLVDLTFSTVFLTNIKSKVKNVKIQSGLYSEVLPLELKNTYIEANQQDGNICLYSKNLTQILAGQSSSKCLIIDYPNNQNIQGSCIIETRICQNLSDCTFQKDQAEYQMYVKVNDGSIQIKQKYEESNNIFPIYQKEKSMMISLAGLSLYQVNASATNFLSDTANDRIAVLQTISHSYQRTWFYTNKVQILQAQYWPLSWGSVGLLRPVMDKMKVVLIDNSCPARAADLLLDFEVYYTYYQMFPQDSNSQVGFVEGYSTFIVVALNDFGDGVYKKLGFYDNPKIVSCFAVASIIAIVGACFGVWIAYLATKTLKLKYNYFLIQSKQLALSKEQTASGTIKTEAEIQKRILQYETMNNVYELRGLFSSKFLQMEPTQIKKQNLKFNFSLFQIPALILDYILRQRILDSLQIFLSAIDECKYQFNSQKLNSTEKSEVSITLNEFQCVYSNFCQQNGYKENDIAKTGQQVFEKYQIQIQSSEGNTKLAYVNIRLKTAIEKQELDLNEDQGESSVKQFLNSECQFSSFEQDFLFFEDLNQAYFNFCTDQGIQEYQQEQIIGSEDLTIFGSTIKEMIQPQMLIGIKQGKSQYPKNLKIPLVRRPASLKVNLMSKLINPDGIGPNLALTVVLYACILIVPLVTPLITFLALSEMTRLQEGVFGRQITFLDFYATNRLDPWWENTPYVVQAAYLHIYVLIFLIFALIEIVSFFMTGLDNNGQYPIKFRPEKRIIMVTFYVLTGIFIFYYVAMLWFAFVWCMLSAIINPSKFLPYTAAAMALTGTIGAKYVIYKLKYEMIFRQYQAKLTQRLATIFQQTLGKVKSQGEAIASKIPLGLRQVGKRIQENIKIDGGVTQIPKDGKELAITATNQLDGLDTTLIELTTAIIIKDQQKINEIIQHMSQQIEMNPEFLQRLSDIAMSDFNPFKSRKQISYGATKQASKKLFRKLFPTLNVDLFDLLLILVLQRDSKSIISILDNIGLKHRQEFEILNAIKLQDRDSLKKLLFELHSQILGKDYVDLHNIFRTLYQMREGDIQSILNEQAMLDHVNTNTKLLNFEHCFPPLCIIGQKQNSYALDTILMTQSIKETLAFKQLLQGEEKEDAVNNFNTSKQTFLKIEKHYLALFYIIKGEQIDMKRINAIVKDQNLPINGDMMEIMYMCSQNSVQSFQQILIKLNCIQNKQILIEFYQLMQKKKMKFVHICKKLQLPENQFDTLIQLIHLLYQVIKLDLLVETYKTNNIPKSDDLLNINVIENNDLQGQKKENWKKKFSLIIKQIKECLDEIKHSVNEIKKNANIVVKRKAIGIKVNDEVINPNEIEIDLKEEETKTEKPTKQKDNEIDQNENYEMFYDTDKNFITMFDGKRDIEDIIAYTKKPVKIDNQGANDSKTKSQEPIDLFEKKDDDAKKEQNLNSEDIPNKNVDGLIYRLLKQIYENDFIKRDFDDEILIFIRNSAMMLLKSDSLINQNDENYENCYNEISEFYDIDSEKFELLIDLITGNPKEIFNMTSEIFDYSLKTDPKDQNIDNKEVNQPTNNISFKGTFDPKRLQVLSQLLQGQKNSLTTAFKSWYHQYRYFSEGKENIHKIINLLELSPDFLNIFKTLRQSQQEDNQNTYQEEYINQIITYLQNEIQNKFNNNDNEGPSYCEYLLITPEYFADDGEDGIRQKVTEIPILAPKDQRIIMLYMQQLIYIKQYDPLAINTIIMGDGPEEKIDQAAKEYRIDLITNILQATSSTTQSNTLNFLLQYAKCVPFKKKNEDKQITHSQDLFVQFNLLIHASQLNVILNKNKGNNFHTNKSLKSLIELTNKALNDDNDILYLEERDFRRALHALYENDYFQDIAIQMFDFLFQTKDDAKLNSFLGVLLGSALKDKKLLVQSVTNLLRNQNIRQDLLLGFGSVLILDIDKQESIKTLCKYLEIDGDFLIKIMSLIIKKTKSLPSVIMELLAGHDEEQSKICTSFLYIMKGDLTMVKTISKSLGIEDKTLTAVLACAVGNFNILAEFYQRIQEKLRITSSKTVRYLLQMAHGDSSCIQLLCQKKTKNFLIHDASLVQAIFNITYIGGRIYSGHITIQECEQMRYFDSAVMDITKKLASTTEKFDWQQKDVTEEDQIDELNNSLKILIKACWNDQRSLNELFTKLNEYKGDRALHWKRIHTILRKQGSNEKAILKFIRKHLKKIVKDRLKPQQLIEQKQKQLMKLLEDTLLPQIKKNYTGKEDEEEEKRKEEEEGINIINVQMSKWIIKNIYNSEDSKNKKIPEDEKLDQDIEKYCEQFEKRYDDQYGQNDGDLPQEDLRKKSHKIGCTYSLTQNKMISQPIYHCIDCGKDLGICIICVQFCHKGHKLVKDNYVQNTHSTCDCGAGHFKNNEKPLLGNKRKVKVCQVIRELQINIQDQEVNFDLAKQKTGVQSKQIDEQEIYPKAKFLEDLAKALNLPNDLNNELSRKIARGLKFGPLVYKREDLNQDTLCLAENLLLMTFGQITDSFMTVFSNKKNSPVGDQNNQELQVNDEKENQIIYQTTMGSFVAIAQADYSKLQQFGKGITEVLGETGSKELKAEDKFSNVIRLARGGKLSKYDFSLGTGSQVCRNSYARLFQQIFGINGKSIMILHYLLTLSDKQAGQAMGFKDDNDNAEIIESDSHLIVNQSDPALKNLQKWVDLELFSNFLQLTDESVEYCKSIVGIMCKYKNALDFIATEKDIEKNKIQVYKALLFTKKEIDLLPLFKRVNAYIPLDLNCLLRKVWKFDMKSLIDFLILFIEIDNKENQTDQPQSKVPVKPEQKVFQYNYLSKLYKLMIGDTNNQEQNIQHVFLTQYENIYFDQQKDFSNEQEKLKKFKIITSLFSITGILYNNSKLQKYTADFLGLKNREVFCTLIKIFNKQWKINDIRILLQIPRNERKALFYCKHFLRATEGNLYSLAKLSDEVLVNNGTHLRSLIASAITGQIQIDSQQENHRRDLMEDVRNKENLLRRECYRIFEKIAIVCLPETQLIIDKKTQKQMVNDYIRFCFDQKFPLHLLGLISQDKNFLSKLLSGSDEYVVNMVSYNHIKNKRNTKTFANSELAQANVEKLLEADRSFLKTFTDFLDPYNSGGQLIELLNTVKKTMKNYVESISIEQQVDNPIGQNLYDALGIKSLITTRLDDYVKTWKGKENSFEINYGELTEMFYNCLNLDRRGTTQIFYFFAKIYETNPILSQIIQILQKLIEGKPIFQHMNSIVLLIMAKSKILEGQTDLQFRGEKDDMLIKQITLWMEGIMLILKKDKNQDIKIISNKFKDIISGYIEYYKPGDDPTITNPCIQRLDNVNFVVDSLIGLISAFKGDFGNMQSLAIKFGGFPTQDKLDSFVKVVRSNKNNITFNEVRLSKVSNKIGALSSMASGMLGQVSNVVGSTTTAGLIGNDVQNQLNDGVNMVQQQVQQVAQTAQSGLQALQNVIGDDPTVLITNPKLIFEKFCNQRRNMTFDHFQSFVRIIGLPLTHAQMTWIFSIADKDKTGEIDIYRFKVALNQMRKILIDNVLQELGLTVTDLVISGVFSLIMLMLMFAFLFVGIEAFSPTSSFSSVTNSALVLVAGGTANVNNAEKKNGDEDINPIGDDQSALTENK